MAAYVLKNVIKCDQPIWLSDCGKYSAGILICNLLAEAYCSMGDSVPSSSALSGSLRMSAESAKKVQRKCLPTLVPYSSDSEQSSSDSEVEVEKQSSHHLVNGLALEASKIDLNISKDDVEQRDILVLPSDDEEQEEQNPSSEVVLEWDNSNDDVSCFESEASSRSEGDTQSSEIVLDWDNSNDVSCSESEASTRSKGDNAMSDASKVDPQKKSPQANDDSTALTDDEDYPTLPDDDDELSLPGVKTDFERETVQNLKKESIIVPSDDESENANSNRSIDPHQISNEKSFPEMEEVEEPSSDLVNCLALDVSKINLNISKDLKQDDGWMVFSSDDEEQEEQNNQSAKVVIKSVNLNDYVSCSESEASSRLEDDDNSGNALSDAASKDDSKKKPLFQAKDASTALNGDDDALLSPVPPVPEVGQVKAESKPKAILEKATELLVNEKNDPKMKSPPPEAKDDSTIDLTTTVKRHDDKDSLALSDELSLPEFLNRKIETVQNLKKGSIIVLSDDESENTNLNRGIGHHKTSNEKSLKLIQRYPKVDVVSPVPVPRVGQVKTKTKQKVRLSPEIMTESIDKEKKNTKKQLKKILTSNQLDKETRKAESAEKARRKRVDARQTLFDDYFGVEGTSRGILDFCVHTEKILVQINQAFIPLLKPHQLEGIKFMYDCVIESVDRFKDEKDGSGCILAHLMGLGKTFQIVVFLHTILTNKYFEDKMKRVLLIVPLNVIENWTQEFEMWFDKCHIRWHIEIFDIRNATTLPRRLVMFNKWHRKGGILLITDTLFKNLSNLKAGRDPNLIVKKCLLSPGPDLVVIDEGHRLKNDETVFNLASSQITTQRRIVLTGTPLQNNLTEYYVMVNFVKPHLLGTKEEFRNRFQNPIEKGQNADSDEEDVKLMKKRIYVLFQLLKGCIHRQDYSILVPYLPPKFDYVLSVRMTQPQIDMYNHFLNLYFDATEKAQRNFFRDKHLLSLVWNHPALVHDYYLDSQTKKKKNFVSTIGDWYLKFIDPDTMYNIELGVKFSLLFVILEMCEKVGDKIVVFSQSLFCLNLMERLLRAKMKTFNTEHGLSRVSYEDILDKTGGISHRWVHDKDYFRIDGGVESEQRSLIIDQFNDVKNRRARLMLVSTKAGGIGTNLIGANRAIIFDVSMNPSNDEQAIFRIYRLGQCKPVYVYRFATFGTMEDKFYKRQIVKQSLSARLVDEQQITRHYCSNDLREMYELDTDYGEEKEKVHPVSKDDALNKILLHHSGLIVNYRVHDSLLENRPEEELDEEERKTALAEYERERNVENAVNPAGPTDNSNQH